MNIRSFFRRKQKVTTEASKTYHVPMYYEHLTVGQWCDYHLAKTDVQRVAAALQIPVEEAARIDRETGEKVLKVFTNALIGEAKFKHRFDLKTKQVGFVPKLDGITYGEHADIVNNAKKENVYKTLPKVLAILYRPVTKTLGKRYEIEEYNSERHLCEDNIALFRDMPMQYADGALAFFLTISRELRANLELSLLRQTKNQVMEAVQ
jgi:hypothetical protein